MKKNYSSPEIKLVKVNTENVMADCLTSRRGVPTVPLAEVPTAPSPLGGLATVSPRQPRTTTAPIYGTMRIKPDNHNMVKLRQLY